LQIVKHICDQTIFLVKTGLIGSSLIILVKLKGITAKLQSIAFVLGRITWEILSVCLVLTFFFPSFCKLGTIKTFPSLTPNQYFLSLDLSCFWPYLLMVCNQPPNLI